MNLKKIICVIAAGLNLEFFISSSVMANPVDDDSSLSEVSSSLFEEDKNSSSRSLIQKKEIPVQRQFLSKVPNFLPLCNDNDTLPPKPPQPMDRSASKTEKKNLLDMNLYCLQCKNFVGRFSECKQCGNKGKTTLRRLVEEMQVCPKCGCEENITRVISGMQAAWLCEKCEAGKYVHLFRDPYGIIKESSYVSEDLSSTDDSSTSEDLPSIGDSKKIYLSERTPLKYNILKESYGQRGPISLNARKERIDKWLEGSRESKESAFYPSPLQYKN